MDLVPEPPRRIRSEDFAEALIAAGAIDGPLHSYRRIVVDAQAGCVLMIHTERFASPAILGVDLGLAGIEVTGTRPHPGGAFVIASELIQTGRLVLREWAEHGDPTPPRPTLYDGCTCTHHLAGDGSYRREPNPACTADHTP